MDLRFCVTLWCKTLVFVLRKDKVTQCKPSGVLYALLYALFSACFPRVVQSSSEPSQQIPPLCAGGAHTSLVFSSRSSFHSVQSRILTFVIVCKPVLFPVLMQEKLTIFRSGFRYRSQKITLAGGRFPTSLSCFCTEHT